MDDMSHCFFSSFFFFLGRRQVQRAHANGWAACAVVFQIWMARRKSGSVGNAEMAVW